MTRSSCPPRFSLDVLLHLPRVIVVVVQFTLRGRLLDRLLLDQALLHLVQEHVAPLGQDLLRHGI